MVLKSQRNNNNIVWVWMEKRNSAIYTKMETEVVHKAHKRKLDEMRFRAMEFSLYMNFDGSIWIGYEFEQKLKEKLNRNWLEFGLNLSLQLLKIVK